MCLIESKVSNVDVTQLDTSSATFSKAFADLVPGVRRQRLTEREIKEHALVRIWALAKAAQDALGIRNDFLMDLMADRFIRRIFDGTALAKFDPALGDIDGYLFGTMRWVGRECRREYSRHAMEELTELSRPVRGVAETSGIAERNDMLQSLRRWTAELPADQRNAVARRYEALSDLDTGGVIKNERVNRHRGLKRLRKLAGVDLTRLKVSPPGHRAAAAVKTGH